MASRELWCRFAREAKLTLRVGEGVASSLLALTDITCPASIQQGIKIVFTVLFIEL